MDSVLIRYQRIALKKGNRAYFTELLSATSSRRKGSRRQRHPQPAGAPSPHAQKRHRSSDRDRSHRSGLWRGNFLWSNELPGISTRCAREFSIHSMARTSNPFASTPNGRQDFPVDLAGNQSRARAAVKEKSHARVDLETPELPYSSRFYRAMPFSVSIKSPVPAASRWHQWPVVSLISGASTRGGELSNDAARCR